MTTNEPLNNAADEVAAAEAELKAAQEKLEAAKAKLAAQPDDACAVEEVTVAAVVVDEETNEVEAVIVEETSALVCDANPTEEAEPQPAEPATPSEVAVSSEVTTPSEVATPSAPQPAVASAPKAESAPAAAPVPAPAPKPEPAPSWVPYSTAPTPASYGAQPQPQAPAAPVHPVGAPVPPAGAVSNAAAPGQPANGYYAPGYAQPQTPPHAGPGAVPPQQPYYGYQQPYYQQPYTQPVVTTKDHVAAGLLAIFLGVFGIHKFYLGYNTAGFIMLAVTIIGGALTFSLAAWVIWLIAIIEGILYLTKSQSEFEQIYVLNKREWF